MDTNLRKSEKEKKNRKIKKNPSSQARKRTTISIKEKGPMKTENLVRSKNLQGKKTSRKKDIS